MKSKGEILIEGPDIKDLKNRTKFKKKHKTYFTKKGKIYSKYVVKFSLKEFVESWKKRNKKRMREMYVKGLRVV